MDNRKINFEKINSIYIAGPFSAKSAHKVMCNVNKALDIGIALYRKGYFPYIPHYLTFQINERMDEIGIDLDYDDCMSLNMFWLNQSDALYFIGPSPGANLELEFATKKGIPIFYSLSEVPNLNKKEGVTNHD